MKRITSVLVWTVGKLFLVPSMFLEQPNAMRHPAIEFIFCHFGQKVTSCTSDQVLGLEVFWHAC